MGLGPQARRQGPFPFPRCALPSVESSRTRDLWLITLLAYFPAQNSTPLAFGENHPVGGKLQDRTELNLTSAAAVDSFL
jgi:hypothetical protein